MSETTRITNAIQYAHIQNSVYVVPNVYVFADWWESDVFVLKRSGYAYEFEVKISRADFIADLKKEKKHRILRTGKPGNGWLTSEHKRRPNRFYYVTPSGLVKKNEVPEYAGLLYCVGNTLKTVKAAPLIHKGTPEYEKVLCMKFYQYWRNGKNG